MAMEPPTVTAQCQRLGVSKAGKKYVYKDARLLDAQAKLTAHLSPYATAEPRSGPLRLTVKWLFDSAGRHPDGTPKPTKPDTDNLQKMLKDCMTRLKFWRDDAQVAEEFISKYWSDRQGIYVLIEEL